MTLEVSQTYPGELTNKVSNGATALNLQRYSNGGAMKFGPVTVGETKGVYNSIYLNGTYYYPFTYNGEAVYLKDNVFTEKKYYKYVNGEMTVAGNYDSANRTSFKVDEAEDRVLGSLTNLASSSVQQSFKNLSPYAANGNGPYEKVTIGGKTYDTYSGEKFMNAPADTAFTTSVIFDYAYGENDTATSYGYTLTLGRDGAALGTTVVGNYDATEDYNGNVAGNYSFTYGSSFGARLFHSIRIYDRVLNEDEIAQNHFVDLAYQFDTDLSAYGQASDALKKKVHEAFKGVDQSSMTADKFSLALDVLLLTDGTYPSDGFEGALSFEGFQMRLYGTPAFRTRFTVDMAAISAVSEEFSVKEIGVLSAKVDADTTFDTLFLAKGTDGAYTVGEGVRREIVYDKDINEIRNGSFGTVIEADAQTPIYTDEYISRAYMIIAYQAGTANEASFVFYCNAAGEAKGLGDTVSLVEMAAATINIHPESSAIYRVYASQDIDKDLTLSELNDALDDAKAHYDAINAFYDEWLTEINGYKSAMVAYQKTALHASTDDILTTAKSSANTLKGTADTAYGEVTAYLSSKKEEDMCTAKEFADAIRTVCTKLQFVANSTKDESLAMTVKEALLSAETYYQGLSRTTAQKELTLSRAKTKIDSAYTALSGYVLNTTVTARMYVLGDSTVCHRGSGEPEQSWMDCFAKETTNELEIINKAVAGWAFKGMICSTPSSSKDTDITHYTDAENSRFGQILDVAQEGDFVVFASTSPNDMFQQERDFFYKTDEFGNVTYATRVSKTEHYFIDENGDRVNLNDNNYAAYGYQKHSWIITPNEYYHMLRDCIDKTLATGATPILVISSGGLAGTTSSTRSFSITRDGVTKNYRTSMAIPGKLTVYVEAYEEVKRILAEEYEGRVVLIDHIDRVFEEYEKVYDAALLEAKELKDKNGRIDYVDEHVNKVNITAEEYARYKLYSIYNAKTSDNTHHGAAGAALVAEKILEVVRAESFDCALKNYLIPED